MRIDRMMAITVMLLNRKRISARELADKFEVSVRTIYRDIDAINMAGIPIISYPGNNGGFGIIDNYKLDHQLLTLKDMISILSALKGINTTLEDRELDTAIDKISALVPNDKVDELELYLEKVVIDIMPWGYGTGHKEKLKQIHKSLITNKLLSFTYRNAKGESLVRTAEPMTLLFKGYGWYLFGYCRLKSGYRLFRLSRMKDIETLEEQFERRNETYKNHIKEEEQPQRPIKLLLKFSPKVRYRVEDYFDEIEIKNQNDNSMIVSVSFPEDNWVYSMLLSYGEDCEVLEPLHIRDILLEKSKKITSIYQT